MRAKNKPNHGIYAMFAFRGVVILAGFLSWRLRWRSGLLLFGLATVLALGGCSAVVAQYFIPVPENPKNISISTPEELAAAPNVSIKTDDPAVLRHLMDLAGRIVIESRHMLPDFRMAGWRSCSRKRNGKLLGAIFENSGWKGMCYTEEPFLREHAESLCRNLNRPLLQNIPERRTVICGAKGGTGV